MSNNITLKDLESSIPFLHTLYDSIRIVDPIKKKVLDYKDSSISETDEVCYNCWGKGKACSNCIAARAINEKKSFVKLESSPDTIKVVTAIPVESTDHSVVLELIKDATESVEAENNTDEQKAFNIVHSLNDLVIKDHLTGLYNRRYIDARLASDVYQATILKQPISAIFLDIDSFKTINDTYGHDAGDIVLAEFAKNIKQHTPDINAWVARYGGDEFFICLIDTDLESGTAVAEILRNSIEHLKITIGDNIISVTSSLGVYTSDKVKKTAEEIVKLADSCMYEAKRNGKNQVVAKADNIKITNESIL